MNRNTESFFQNEPTLEAPRSMWERTITHKTTFNNGYIVPIYMTQDIFPGWTIKNTTSILIRMQTPEGPTMDNCYCDTYWFEVKLYSIWEHVYEMYGENENGAWTQTTEYEVPMFKTDNYAYGINDMYTYMGVPYNVKGLEISQLPARAYCRIYNYFFRCESLIAPVAYTTADTTVQYDGTSTIYGGKLLKAAKFFDYLTSCLPEPQKGPDGAVTIPLGTSAPVFTGSTNYDVTTGNALRMLPISTGVTMSNGAHNLMTYKSSNSNNLKVGFDDGASTTVGNFQDVEPINLYADLSQALSATINAQRFAFATQRIYEHDALYGTRRNEIIRKYGVVTTNEGMQIPKYLGGTRFPINIETCLQNSSDDAQSPLGTTGAFSVSFNINEDFTHSFDDWAILMGLMVVRCDHTYQQGLERQWSRKRRFDFYHPEFAHIGNTPVYNKQIFAQGTSQDDEVFGYQEAWAEYKYQPNRISGELLSTYAQSLDVWHYGDDYTSLPVLSQDWIEEPVEFLDRTLKVQSTTANQFIADIAIHQVCAAPMPLHCNPGLIDHF